MAKITLRLGRPLNFQIYKIPISRYETSTQPSVLSSAIIPQTESTIMTPFETLESKFGLQDCADSTRLELEGFYFPSVLGNVTESYIRLVPDDDNEYYSIAADFTTNKKVSESEGEAIADEISEKFFEVLLTANSEEEVDEIRSFHNGTTVSINGKKVY